MLDIDIKNERIVKEYIDGETIFEMVKTAVPLQRIYRKSVKWQCLRKRQG